jgi:hypothetical protein
VHVLSDRYDVQLAIGNVAASDPHESSINTYATGGRSRLWLPTVLLLIVALTQILLTRTANLSPWKPAAAVN